MIRDLLAKLNEQGKTLIVMTHDEDIINRKGVRHFIMKNGELNQNV
jgi:ABC-type ATPase involved in cell division